MATSSGSYGRPWSEAWWWLAIPAVLAAGLIITYKLSPSFYREWILPEGYGFLELGHFFIPLTGFFVALRLIARRYVREQEQLDKKSDTQQELELG